MALQKLDRDAKDRAGQMAHGPHSSDQKRPSLLQRQHVLEQTQLLVPEQANLEA